MINNLLMFYQNIFIICDVIPIFLYIFLNTMKILYLSMRIKLNLKSAFIKTYQKLLIFGQIVVTYFLLYSL